MRTVRRLFLVCATLSLAACVNPRVQANMAQAMTDFGTELAGMRQDIAVLTEVVDSLRTVAAKQDTIIERLANLAGMPIPHR
jgi:hypothetical protein